eukprot:GHVU01185598.1.p1 GENE.GHVU01185598.1~~GHVU01185598.1.p1  ORF type:complete len:469 (-),score=92.32 GHVU01185598.1:1165-2391(-)
MWNTCRIVYSSDGGATFEERPMERMDADTITGDIIFRAVLPALTLGEQGIGGCGGGGGNNGTTNAHSSNAAAAAGHSRVVSSSSGAGQETFSSIPRPSTDSASSPARPDDEAAAKLTTSYQRPSSLQRLSQEEWGACVPAASPISSSAREYLFYLKDGASEDCDRPPACCANGFESPRNRGGLYGGLLGVGLQSLRDGELAEGDRVTSIGITIQLSLKVATSTPRSQGRALTAVESRGPSFNQFVSSGSYSRGGEGMRGGGGGGGGAGGNGHENGAAPTRPAGENGEVEFGGGVADSSSSSSYWLHYLDESDGAWKYRQFDREGCVALLEARSVTFCVLDTSDSTWIRAPEAVDLRIAFAGNYVLFKNGRLFACSAAGEGNLFTGQAPQCFAIHTPKIGANEVVQPVY